jgi:hypothetical protein
MSEWTLFQSILFGPGRIRDCHDENEVRTNDASSMALRGQLTAMRAVWTFSGLGYGLLPLIKFCLSYLIEARASHFPNTDTLRLAQETSASQDGACP